MFKMISNDYDIIIIIIHQNIDDFSMNIMNIMNIITYEI